MDKIKYPQLPFLTREMLQFGRKTAFSIVVDVWADSNYTLNLIGATREGLLKYAIETAGTGAMETFTFRIPNIPIFATFFTGTTNINRGQVFASIYLTANGEKILKLASGYISNQSSLNWPQTQADSESRESGFWTAYNGAAPAAGANHNFAVPANQHWVLHGMSFALITDANVANRRVHIRTAFGTSAGRVAAFPSVDQVASSTMWYHFAEYGHIPDETDDDRILVNFPANIHLRAGATITTDVVNIQATDQLTACMCLIEKFIIGG